MKNVLIVLSMLLVGCTREVLLPTEPVEIETPDPGIPKTFLPLDGTLKIETIVFNGEVYFPGEPSIVMVGDSIRIYYTASMKRDPTKVRLMYSSAKNVTDEWVNPRPVNLDSKGTNCTWVAKIGIVFYLFATNGYGFDASEDRNVYGYTSSDGINFTSHGIVFNKADYNITGFGNTTIGMSPSGELIKVNGKYHALLEGWSDNKIWETYAAESTSPLGPWTMIGKCSSMQVEENCMYGGSCLIYENNEWHVFYHYGSHDFIPKKYDNNLPTYLAYSKSKDGLNWNIVKAPFKKFEAMPYGLGTDQVADAFVLQVKGQTYLSASYDANFPFQSQLRLWSYGSTFKNFIR
jgi:hypothetical protein